jgi:hypothetical protein
MLHRTTVFKVFSIPEGEYENIQIPGGYGFTFIHRLQWKRPISIGWLQYTHNTLYTGSFENATIGNYFSED